MSYYKNFESEADKKQNDNLCMWFVKLWNSKGNIGHLRKLNSEDREALVNGVRVHSYTQQDIETVIDIVSKAPRLNGNISGIVADIHWILRENNFDKILSGHYKTVEETKIKDNYDTNFKMTAYKYAYKVGLKYPGVKEHLFTEAEEQHLKDTGFMDNEGYITKYLTELEIPKVRLKDNLQVVLNPQSDRVKADIKKLMRDSLTTSEPREK